MSECRGSLPMGSQGKGVPHIEEEHVNFELVLTTPSTVRLAWLRSSSFINKLVKILCEVEFDFVK